MLTKEIYKIEAGKNLLTKYNIEYDKCDIKSIICATYIANLIDGDYPLTQVQVDKLKQIINCLVQPSRYWDGNDQEIIHPLLLERELITNFGIATINDELIICE